VFIQPEQENQTIVIIIKSEFEKAGWIDAICRISEQNELFNGYFADKIEGDTYIMTNKTTISGGSSLDSYHSVYNDTKRGYIEINFMSNKTHQNICVNETYIGYYNNNISPNYTDHSLFDANICFRQQIDKQKGKAGVVTKLIVNFNGEFTNEFLQEMNEKIDTIRVLVKNLNVDEASNQQ